jgi:hypothetical protein
MCNLLAGTLIILVEGSSYRLWCPVPPAPKTFQGSRKPFRARPKTIRLPAGIILAFTAQARSPCPRMRKHGCLDKLRDTYRARDGF